MIVLPVQSSEQIPMANLQCLHVDLSVVQLCLAKSVLLHLCGHHVKTHICMGACWFFL